jgi:FkbM family methyltransferase
VVFIDQEEWVMEDLWFNKNAAFTKWVTASGHLRDKFVLIDVGVQGDANVRWDLLGDNLVVHGFDPIEEVVTELNRVNRGRRNRHYHHFAIGDADRTVTFYFNAANPTASSMYLQGPSRFDHSTTEQARTVAMRTLDTLLAEGTISQPDFLKVDVEGFEKSVFAGTQKLLSMGTLLGIESETNFGVSPTYPKSHFATLSDILVEHCFTVFDIGFNRVPRSSFMQSLARHAVTIPPDAELGKPATLNVLFCRELIDEHDSPHHYINKPTPVTIDQITKMMIIYELYGLNDIAVDAAVRFRDILGPRLDVEKAIALLSNANCRSVDCVPVAGATAGATDGRIAKLEERVRAMENSTSWRVTAPLRKLRGYLR